MAAAVHGLTSRRLVKPSKNAPKKWATLASWWMTMQTYPALQRSKKKVIAMPAPLNSFSSSMLSCLPRFCHTFSVLLLQYPMCINRNVFVYKETEHANYCALRGNSTTMSENMQGCSMAHFPARGVFESVTGLEQVYTYLIWPRLFKRWIALSTGQITIQRICIRETDCIIHWIDFYPVDSAVQRLNNWGQKLECL